jgi:hypothetical protein
MKVLHVALCVASLAFSVSSQAQIDFVNETRPLTIDLLSAKTDLVAVQFEFNESFNSLTYVMSFGMDASRAKSKEYFLLQLHQIRWVNQDDLNSKSEFIPVYMALNLDIPSSDSLSLRLSYVKRSALITVTPMPEFSIENTKKKLKTDFPKLVSQTAQVSALSNLKQLGIGMMILLSDYDDIYPYVQGTNQVFKIVEPYVKNDELTKSLNPKGGRILFNMSLAGASASDVEAPGVTPMFYESETWPDGRRLVAFADASVKWVKADEWAKMTPNLKLNLKRRGKPLKDGG